MRRSIAALLGALLTFGWAAGAQAQAYGPQPHSAPAAFVAPCDTLIQGCYMAYSVAARMIGSYRGPLFQILRADNATMFATTRPGDGLVQQRRSTPFATAGTATSPLCTIKPAATP